MAYCPKCGTEIKPGDRYCPNCGTPASFATSNDVHNNPPTESNGFAIAGFVCSFFIPILGIIFSAIGLNRAPKCHGQGKGLATAGLVISIISIVLGVIIACIIDDYIY